MGPLGQGADGDKVGSGQGVVPDVAEGDSAGCLDLDCRRSFARAPRPGLHRFGLLVVDQQSAGSRSTGELQLIQRFYFDVQCLESSLSSFRHRCFQCVPGLRQGPPVIVFHHHFVAQIDPVCVPSSGYHR